MPLAVPPVAIMPITPGAYLKRRRQAQHLRLSDVAARIGTRPHVPEHDRIAWLEKIEADIVPASIHTIDALSAAYRFDRSVLATLDAIARGVRDPEHAPRLCRVCACSWRDACITAVDGHHAEGCAWVQGEDLCTGCVPAPADDGEPA